MYDEIHAVDGTPAILVSAADANRVDFCFDDGADIVDIRESRKDWKKRVMRMVDEMRGFKEVSEK